MFKAERYYLYSMKLISLCFKYSLIPSIWLKAIISPIPKSSLKDHCVPLNYCGISLLSNVYKMYSSIINKRITKYCDFNSVLVDEQNGFRRDRSCNDHIFLVFPVLPRTIFRRKNLHFVLLLIWKKPLTKLTKI